MIASHTNPLSLICQGAYFRDGLPVQQTAKPRMCACHGFSQSFTARRASARTWNMTPLSKEIPSAELTLRKLKASVDPERIPLRSVDRKLTLCSPLAVTSRWKWLLKSIELSSSRRKPGEPTRLYDTDLWRRKRSLKVWSFSSVKAPSLEAIGLGSLPDTSHVINPTSYLGF